eukprot:scaffold992_cov387-Prasinococcus_capsulatus_cf.AAC.3
MSHCKSTGVPRWTVAGEHCSDRPRPAPSFLRRWRAITMAIQHGYSRPRQAYDVNQHGHENADNDTILQP